MNNVLVLPNDPMQRPVFKISTTRGMEDSLERTIVKLLPLRGSGRSATTTATGGGGGGGGGGGDEAGDGMSFQGLIDWRSKRIRVGEVSKYVDEVKGNASGPMSL